MQAYGKLTNHRGTMRDITRHRLVALTTDQQRATVPLSRGPVSAQASTTKTATMNSGGELWQSGSRTGETVATHCNVANRRPLCTCTALGSAATRAYPVQSAPRALSATSGPWDAQDRELSELHRTAKASTHNRTRRCTEARLPTQRTAHQAAPFAQANQCCNGCTGG